MKLFASDYDGTYCKHHRLGKKQLKHNLKVTKKWQEEGNLFAIATGRDLSLMKVEEWLRGVEYDYLIGLNGAIIVSKEKKVLFRQTMNQQIAREIVSLIQAQHILNFTITDGMNGHLATPKHITNKMYVLFTGLKMVAKIYTLSLEEALNREVVQIAVETNSHEEALQFAKLVNESYGDHVMAFANLVHVDICSKGVSKATGIEYVANLHQLKSDDIYCIGDSFNDLPMIETFNGFTMVEACAEIKEKASATFETVADAMQSIK